MTKIETRAVCSRCAALCCLAFEIERSEQFAFDKKGGEACRFLDAQYECTIHDDLRGRGFRGCSNFDCNGAGQRVTQDLFAESNWQEDSTLIKPLSQAFFTLLRSHRVLAQLQEAKKLNLPAKVRQQLEQLAQSIHDSEDRVEDLELLLAEVKALLQELQNLPGLRMRKFSHPRSTDGSHNLAPA